MTKEIDDLQLCHYYCNVQKDMAVHVVRGIRYAVTTIVWGLMFIYNDCGLNSSRKSKIRKENRIFNLKN